MSITDELKKFREFKKTYIFNQKEIIERNGKLFCDGELLKDGEEKEIGESEKWINVGYKLKGAYSKVLSNLFPYEINFRDKKLNSIEAFFQGIKFKEIQLQDMIFKYSGLDSNNIKVANNYDWKKDQVLFYQGQAIKRTSKEYEDLIDELYISALQNPLYRNVIMNCPKEIIHSIGEPKSTETVFTRYEFELQLNALRAFLKQ